MAQRAQVEIVREVVPDPDPDTSYLEQDGWEDRLDLYQRGLLDFVGVIATANVRVPHGADWITFKIHSPGLWCIESDSGEEYFNEVFEEERRTLLGMLESLHDYEVTGQTVDLSAFLNESVSVMGVDHG